MNIGHIARVWEERNVFNEKVLTPNLATNLIAVLVILFLSFS